MTWLRTVGMRFMLAFLLAFALWVFVSYTQNPDQNLSFDTPVEIDNLASGLLVVDSNGLPRTTRPTVVVTVQAAADALVNVRERDLRAYVDVENLQAGQYNLDVQVDPTRNDLTRIQLSSEPDRIAIRLEQEITRTVALTVTVAGNVPFSFEALAPRVTARNAQVNAAAVRGPQNRVERVATVRATVDIDRLTSTYNSPRSLEALDIDGRVVDGVTIEPAQVNVQVPIISSVGVKRVPVVPQLLGEPGSGYYVRAVGVEPQLVTLTGSSGPLDDVESISTAGVDVEGATGTFTRTVTLLEPLNARLRFGEPTTAVVTVQIAALDQPYQVTLPVPVQAVGVSPGLQVSLSPAVVQFTLQGRSIQLSQLDASSLLATVSVRGLGPGVYSVAPEITLPEGIALASAPEEVTVTLRAPPTPTQTATITVTETLTLEPTESPTPQPTVPVSPTVPITSTVSIAP